MWETPLARGPDSLTRRRVLASRSLTQYESLRLTNESLANLAAGVVVAILIAGAGCSSKPPGPPRPNADGGPQDGVAGAGGRDAKLEAPTADASCVGDVLTKKSNGQACKCPGDCSSNFCVDGVCCNAGCTESCKTCNDSSSMGTCAFIAAGTPPHDPATCVAAEVSTCGWDGTCDGAGGCRRYRAGLLCSPGMCSGASVVGARSCDGMGRCRPGPTVICVPFQCDPATGACVDTCTQSSQCVSGQQCVAGSCGKKMKGATCKANNDCASGFCADNVCCNVACAGGCVSCALPDRLGTCWPIDPGVVDPRAACKKQDASTCGKTGTCDGFGGCEKFAPETQCIAPTCTGTRRNTPGTCDGLGTCRAQGVQNCSPFKCVDGACNKVCVSDNDCETGHACVKGLCGLKQNGQPCSAGAECLSTHCVDGVCCDGDCTGACRSCSLASAPGKCTSIAAGNVDPRGVCQDTTAASCATNGKCDGAGGCQNYKMGTICAPQTCAANVYTPASTCSATGQCVAPDSLPCSPYVCNGSACFNACTMTDGNCLPLNVCNGNSCGKKNIGASCSAASECQTSFCAQGACCDKACDGACQSCALTGTLGACTNVPTDTADPAGLCQDGGGAGCGTNGKCQAGACQKYTKGTPCKDSTCPTTTTNFTAGSTCDGNGACQTPAPSSCFPYSCATKVCKVACGADMDCAAPAVCIMGSCGLKGMGKTCADGTECLSKFCAQGICCNSTCNGSCQSCALAASLGTCSSAPNGAADPQGTCQNKGQATCDTDGLCDGKGACRLYAAGTQCVPPACPTGGSTLTQPRTCDGVGNCQAASSIACAPFLCSSTSMAACNAACTNDTTDCLFPNICDPKTNLCGNKKRLGQPCAVTGDCLTGDFCVDGVCCGSSMCATCQACNVVGEAGTCSSVGSGDAEPHARCVANPPCGNTGSCNGAGVCEQASAGTSCGTASCSETTLTSVSNCTGTGTCATAATSSCSPYICGSGMCKVTCAGDGDCIAPFTCQGAVGAMSCALKKNGLVCMTGGQCISGNCIDGVCCGSSSCQPCQACNLSGNGTCTPVAAGTTAPTAFCATQDSSTCGTNGKCDGGGLCQKYADDTICSSATCPADATTLTMAGTCMSGSCMKPTQACAPYFCNGGTACLHTCSDINGCANGTYCTGAGGTCVQKKTSGQGCATGDQCMTNNCVDGVCCGTASCGHCQACNLSGDGTCTNLTPGTTPTPAAFCATQDSSTCGTNGKCDGGGGCQKYADDTICSSAACPTTSTLTPAGKCSGGQCVVGPQLPCSPFLCTANACANTCSTDNDCANGTYCSGTVCVAKKMNGDACTPALATQCAFGHCVDGVCCDTDCTGACFSCALPASKGVCTPVAPGTADPRGVCHDLTQAACSTNGLCDGAGACQTYAASTPCSSASCTPGTSTRTPPGTCSTGICSARTVLCDPYMCGSDGDCRTSCVDLTDCVLGNYCSGGHCVAKKNLGTMCTVDGECGMDHCVENVCCSSGPCSPCHSCALPGAKLGTCTLVNAGDSDPSGTCVNGGSIGCGTTGKCDAFGMCAFQDGSVMCAGATCSSGSELTSKRFCDGKGTCSAGTVTDCDAFACDPSVPACFTICSHDTSCSTGNRCDTLNMSCGPI
jgi:hypothetical protein